MLSFKQHGVIFPPFCVEGCDVGVLVEDIMERSPNILHITGACALISVGWLTAEYLYR
jgi:hypothetical protein